MKKTAVTISCALITLVCVFTKTNPAAGQGKTAAQAKKSPVTDAPLPHARM